MVILVVAALVAAFAQTKKPLTNESVLKMVKAGFEQPMIVKAIEANDTDFDVSVEALMDLKTAGVNQAIIEAMLAAEAKKKAPDPTAKPATAPPPDPNDPNSRHDPGIYWLSKNQSGRRMVRLQPTTYSTNKTVGIFAGALTAGIHKVKWKAILAGPQATVRINEPTPELWFYFDEKPQGFGQPAALSVQASKPEEFALAKMERSGKDRLLVVGQGS